MKVCKDCAHKITGSIHYMCALAGRSMVYGDVMTPCAIVRGDRAMCGPTGAWWGPKRHWWKFWK
jgi:hypothetical protein